MNAAGKQARLGVSMQALYDKINRTEPGLMRALVQGNAQRLEPVVQPMGIEPLLSGWRIRIIDGNHLPASHKRLKALRGLSAAALPGHSLVVYDPDIGLVTDLLPSEDAHAQERAVIGPLLPSAQPGEAWIADRNFCTRTIMQGWSDAGACFIVREHAHHPAVIEAGPWRECAQVSSGHVFEQAIAITPRAAAVAAHLGVPGHPHRRWRHRNLVVDQSAAGHQRGDRRRVVPQALECWPTTCWQC